MNKLKTLNELKNENFQPKRWEDCLFVQDNGHKEFTKGKFDQWESDFNEFEETFFVPSTENECFDFVLSLKNLNNLENLGFTELTESNEPTTLKKGLK